VACAVLFTITTDPAHAQSKAKAVKAAVPNFGNAEAISEEELKVYLYFLASDELEGRNFPSRGYDTAALYVASHLAEWGLKPGGSTTGTVGPLQPYFMPFELVAKTVIPGERKVTITGVDGGGRERGSRGPAAVPADGAQAQTPRAPRTVELQYGNDWSVASGR